jgi:hypothetical protein
MLIDKLKAEEQLIRSRWFPNHVASLSLAGNIQELFWRNPDSGTYHVQYFLHQNVLFVTGDIGEAVYKWSSPIPEFRWIANCDLDYFAGKCTASESGVGYKEWDASEVTEWLGCYRTEDEEFDAYCQAQAENADDCAFDSVQTKGDWEQFLTREGEELFGVDWWELLDIGMRIAMRAHGHLVGIRMAIEQLESRKNK